MALFNGDAVIKTAIELALDDVRGNPWLIQDMMGQFVDNQYLRDKYGQKEIDRCKEWLGSDGPGGGNKIDVYMRHRIDRDQYPCITIELGSSSEREDMRHMADASSVVETIMPGDGVKTIPFVVKAFTPSSYDQASGLLEAPSEVDLRAVAPGMVLVNPANGEGWVIKELGGDNGLLIDAGTNLPAVSKFAVVPKYQFYRARREHSFFQESYTIGCHVVGDTAQLMWLHAIVVYALLRYREGLLEANDFTQSSISSGPITPNDSISEPGAENAWSRYVTLTGMVENTWLKTPRRIIESLQIKDGEGESELPGIKIISQDPPDELDDPGEQLWTTVEGDESE